jgi:hypothetical protein
MARDPDLDLLKATRLLAFAAVEKRDADYLLRYILRWYSRTFATPLHEVDALPLEDVLEHYFECQAEDMEDEDKDEVLARLIETRSERLEREAKEAEEAVADDAFYKATLAEAAAARVATTTTDLNRKLKDDDGPIVPLAIMGERLPVTFEDASTKVDPKIKKISEGIRMEFVDAKEIEGLSEWDVLSDPKPGKPGSNL